MFTEVKIMEIFNGNIGNTVVAMVDVQAGIIGKKRVFNLNKIK